MLQTSPIIQSRVREELEARTLGQHLDARLERLLEALGQPAEVAPALRVAALLGASWRHELVSRGPLWSSEITDDHSPFEFSLALGGASSSSGRAGVGDARESVVRLLTEPQDPARPSLRASWAVAASIHEQLASERGVSLRRLEAVADLFEPGAAAEAQFSVWHSAVFGQRRAPAFKVYLNPSIHGSEDAEASLDAALRRLGVAPAWAAVRSLALRRPGLDVPMYLSLDLSDAPDARVKVYIAHRHATSRDVVDVLSPLPGFEESAIERWLQRLLGTSGPFWAHPPVTSHAFGGVPIGSFSTTLHLPVRDYLPHDVEVARRVCEFLDPEQQGPFLRALRAVAERPLHADRGLTTYVSIRATPAREATTIYLAPQLYTPCADGSSRGLAPLEIR
jgi:hypothetical protein